MRSKIFDIELGKRLGLLCLEARIYLVFREPVVEPVVVKIWTILGSFYPVTFSNIV